MLPPLPAALIRSVIYPAWRAIRRDDVLERVRALERRERLPREELAAHRNRRIRETLAAAYEHVPYYREVMDRAKLRPEDVRGPAELAALPFLTKGIIRAEGNRMVTADPARKGYRSSTGGSTGEPLYFYNDASAGPTRRANTIRAYRWAGVDIGDRQALLWGFSLNRSAKDRIAAAVRQYLGNVLPLSTFDLSEEGMRRHDARLRRFRPAYMVAYPSAAALLAEYYEQSGPPAFDLRAIVTSGERLWPQQREVIERAFRCRVFDRYGSREFSNVAAECERHEGLHLFTDLFHVEIVREDGAECGEGETGEIVITDYANLYMPFIRYRTGDLAVKTERPCPCGRTSPLVERIEGRTFDAIATPSGKMVGGFFWTWLSRAVPGIRRFRIEQDTPAAIVFRVVPGRGWEAAHEETLRAKIAETCGSDLAVSFEIVEDIPLTRAGKSRFIISRVRRDGAPGVDTDGTSSEEAR